MDDLYDKLSQMRDDICERYGVEDVFTRHLIFEGINNAYHQCLIDENRRVSEEWKLKNLGVNHG